MTFTPQQQVVLAIMPKISAILALLADGWIITEVLTDQSSTSKQPPKRHHPYHRLLCAMSLYGSLESLSNFASTWPMPRGTPGVYGAMGTQTTCTLQGYLESFSMCAPMYNACLSFYYLLVIKYGWSEEALRRTVEPCMHFGIFAFTFGSATYTLTTDLYNPANLWCWIASVPSNCWDSWRYGDQATCIRGDNAWIFRWAFYYAPLWGCIFIASKCVWCICCMLLLCVMSRCYVVMHFMEHASSLM
jgi:hypothetical protein